MDPPKHDRRTRSQSQPRPPSPPTGRTASTGGTTPHRTEEWTEASSTGVTTPLTTAKSYIE